MTDNCRQTIDNWIINTQHFCDTKNKCALFASVVSQDLYWKISSTSEFASISNDKNENLKDHITSPGIIYRLKQFQVLVAVGGASYEMDKNVNAEQNEYQRANRRALEIQKTLKENVPTNACIYTMTLGRNPNVVDDSTKQRLIVIIGIFKPEAGFDVVDALNNNINKQIKALPFNRSDYPHVHTAPMNC